MPTPAAGNADPTPPPAFFKDADELAAFIRRVTAEELTPALERAIAPLTERQTDIMRDMLAESQRSTRAAARPPGHMFARFCRARALAVKETGRRDFDVDAIAFVVRRHWGDDALLPGLEGIKTLQKAAAAVQAGDPNSLGNLLIPEWSQEFILLLRNVPLVRSLARVIPNPSGSLTLRRQTSGGTAYWVGEGSPAIPSSKPGVGLMHFTRKKLAALGVISNDMLRTPSSEADQFLLDELIIATALAEDLALLRADGTEFTPRGIRNLVAPAHVYSQTGATLDAIDSDHSLALQLVEEANVSTGANTDPLHWILVPRTWRGLWLAKPSTDTGARPYREELNQGRLLGYPAHKTNQVPRNLGAGGDKTETYLVHAPSLLLADTLNTVVDVFPGGAYQDGNLVVPGISTDETVVRAIRELDFNIRHPEAAVVIKDVTLGA